MACGFALELIYDREVCVSRVGKTGSLGPWVKVIVHCKCVYIISKGMTVRILTLLQYAMILLQSPKDPVLSTLMSISMYNGFNYFFKDHSYSCLYATAFTRKLSCQIAGASK
jgi:hypothetical protein